MELKQILVGLIASATLVAGSAQATVLYNNLGAASTGTDPVAGFGPLADSFSTGASAVSLDTLTLLVDGNAGSGGSFTVNLLTDNNTSPGAVLASGTFSDSVLAGTLTPLTFTCNGCSLAADTRYWIQLADAGGTTTNWSWSSDISGVGVANEYFANSNGVFANNPNGPYQMELIAGVPEPATWALMLAGLGIIGAGLRMNRRKFGAAGLAYS